MQWLCELDSPNPGFVNTSPKALGEEVCDLAASSRNADTGNGHRCAVMAPRDSSVGEGQRIPLLDVHGV